LGVENENYGSVVANGGYRVELRHDDNTVIAELKNSQPHVKNTLVFENIYPTELVDNWYNIFVIAGDNLNADNAYLRFYIDTGAPSISTAAALNPLTGTSLGSPKILTTTSVTISGTAEAGATIKVYVNGTEQTAASTTARSDGTWDITVSVASGVTSKIEVTATDAAGNESAKLLLGYAMADASAPTVTVTSPVDGLSTSESSVEVSGSVTKDAWETYSGISVTLEVAGRAGAVTVPLSATGTFSIAVSLSEGGNTIIVTARDAVGNSGSASRTVTRTVTPWGTYAIILVIVALILSAVAIFKKR